MTEFWEPWQPEIGQRVRVKLNGECQVEAHGAAPPPTVSDDELRSMMQAGEDVANRYYRDEWITGHPEVVNGVSGTVTSVDRRSDMAGHYYRVMFDQTVEPGALIGIDLAAVELEAINA